MNMLKNDIQYIKGIGPQKSKALNKLGIYTLEDLISYFPRKYEDRRCCVPISKLVIGESLCIRAMIAAEPRLSQIRRGLDLVKLRAVDETGSINITFFNQSYLKNSFHTGESFIFYGKVGGCGRSFELTNPIFEKDNGSGQITGRIVPIYHLTAGISQNVLIKSISAGLAVCGLDAPDYIPVFLRNKYNLAQAEFAYNNIHFPADEAALELARRRLIFEELFVLSCALNFMRSRKIKRSPYRLKNSDAQIFIDSLPYSLTGAQTHAIQEIFSDMSSGVPMSRLVQGDVGSGKTVVAAAAVWDTVSSGYQAAFMAPTEILAKQHYNTLKNILGKFNINISLLIGSMTVKQKREVYDKLRSGETDVVIGTHAVLSENAEFKSLALVITDEQHRFGVEQRAALTAKSEQPHVLVMSATPIPRTLALMIYGELDISVIDELPPGRTPIDTFVINDTKRSRLNNFIRKQVAEGRQVYIVCPKVEETEESDLAANNLKSAESYGKELSESIFPDLTVGIIHGKMKSCQKEAVMADFVSGKIQILVATTVIEVGVDVPNANLIVIENAERFGLSQLHQLRGRVGRGTHHSYCVLINNTNAETAASRLKIMASTNDGFKISEEDLKLRGPGDFFGSRQHGLPEMKIADLTYDTTIINDAQDAAKELLDTDPGLCLPENQTLKQRITELFELKV